MGMFKKVLMVDDVKKELHPTTFGAVELYPNGTKRIIKRLTINGWKVYNQIASIKSVANNDSYYYYNGWETVDEADKILLDLFGVSCSNGRTYPTELKLKWYQELIGAFKNRRY